MLLFLVAFEAEIVIVITMHKLKMSSLLDAMSVTQFK